MSKAEYSLDVSAEVCPLTTVKTKVFLDDTASWPACEDCRLSWPAKSQRPPPSILDGSPGAGRRHRRLSAGAAT